MNKEVLKRWLDNLVRIKREELSVKNFSDDCSICTSEWVHLYKGGRYIAETLEIPYEVRDIDEYYEIKFIYNRTPFVYLEEKEA